LNAPPPPSGKPRPDRAGHGSLAKKENHLLTDERLDGTGVPPAPPPRAQRFFGCGPWKF